MNQWPSFPVPSRCGQAALHISARGTYFNTMPRAVVHRSLLFVCSFGMLLSAATIRHTPTVQYQASLSLRQNVLALFLPGRGGSRFDLQVYGLLDTLRAARLPLDIVGLHAPFRYYLSHSILRRIHDDAITPALDSGYQRIWLICNSMGTVGSLLYSRKHPTVRIEGIIMLGPFLGDEPIADEIAAAGGVKKWTPRDTISDNYQRDMWTYLKMCLSDTTGSLPKLYLLAGTDDRLHAGQQLLADALPPADVFWAPGGHDWGAWRVAFAAFVGYARERKLFD
jgi:pimeloyl-ACP methyl ester carboxylesterase